jgi:type I restriction enzyme R subunit
MPLPWSPSWLRWLSNSSRKHERDAELGATTSSRSAPRSVKNDSAVLEMGDDALKTIARELVESVRRTASIDWKENAQVGA